MTSCWTLSTKMPGNNGRIYPVSVALGTIALTVCAVGYAYRRTVQRERKTVEAGLNP
jgi:hypothetical protein